MYHKNRLVKKSFPQCWQLARAISCQVLPSFAIILSALCEGPMLISGRVQVWDIQLNEFSGTGVALCLRSVLLDWSITQPHLSTHPSCMMIQLTTFNTNHCHSTIEKGSSKHKKRLPALAVVWQLPCLSLNARRRHGQIAHFGGQSH